LHDVSSNWHNHSISTKQGSNKGPHHGHDCSCRHSTSRFLQLWQLHCHTMAVNFLHCRESQHNHNL